MQSHNITIPDLRAGFAYVMAAILAEGTTTINGVEMLDRGYADLDNKLKSIGVDIKREFSDKKPASIKNILEKDLV